MPEPEAAVSVTRIIGRVLPWLYVLLAVYGLWLVAAWVIQRGALFPRQYVQPLSNPGEGIHGLETSWLETDEGQVEWWFAPGRRASEDEGRPTVFYLHGNAEAIDYQSRLVSRYQDLGANVVLCEYRGYCRSAGEPTQEALTADQLAVFDLVAARADVDPDRIVFHGRSVGTGVACALAAQRPPRALILTAPFTSVAELMAGYAVPRPLVRDPFDNRAVLRDSPIPTLILHGDRDTVVPVRHGRLLAEDRAKARLVLFEGFGHNDLPTEGERYWRAVRDFLVETGALHGSAAGR